MAKRDLYKISGSDHYLDGMFVLGNLRPASGDLPLPVPGLPEPQNTAP